MTTRIVTLVMVAAFSAACSNGTPDDAGTEGALLEAPPETAGVQLSLHAPPGLDQDARRCHLIVLPGGDGTDIEALEHRLSDGALEVRLSHTDLSVDAALANAGLVLCDSVEGHAGPDVYASAEGAGGVSMPAGVAVHFEPYEVVLLEVRFDAAAGAARDEARLNLWFSTSAPETRTAVATTQGGVPAPASGQ